MNRLTANYVIIIIEAAVMLSLGLVLLATYTAVSMDVETELKQAANFDRWGTLILCTGGSAIIWGFPCVYDAMTYTSLRAGKKCAYVAELIYILGLEKEGPVEMVLDDAVEVASVRSEESARSIFGLGHDDSRHWTFAGRKANPLKEPAP